MMFYLRTLVFLGMVAVQPPITWAYRMRRPARHALHKLPKGLHARFRADVITARAALERLRFTNLSIDTAELTKRQLTAVLSSNYGL